MKPYYSKTKQLIFSWVMILTGNLLLAFLVAAFIIPHDIIMGGTTGIGIALNRVIPQLDISIFVLVLNIILLILGLIILGKRFFQRAQGGGDLRQSRFVRDGPALRPPAVEQ